jgi:archaemetzincin
MKITYVLFVSVCLLIISCYGNSTGPLEIVKEVKPANEKVIPKNTSIFIDVQPFDDISAELTDYVFTELKKVYPVVELKTAIVLPQTAYYKPRNRYRADSLLSFLSERTQTGHVAIGLTTKDISCTNDGNADWGIIGYGYMPGNACVVSTYRLKKNNTPEQLFKAAIHELGHTQGLDHCPDKTCFMRDAEGKNPIDEEKDFCRVCKKFLVGRGWTF